MRSVGPIVHLPKVEWGKGYIWGGSRRLMPAAPQLLLLLPASAAASLQQPPQVTAINTPLQYTHHSSGPAHVVSSSLQSHALTWSCDFALWMGSTLDHSRGIPIYLYPHLLSSGIEDSSGIYIYSMQQSVPYSTREFYSATRASLFAVSLMVRNVFFSCCSQLSLTCMQR